MKAEASLQHYNAVAVLAILLGMLNETPPQQVIRYATEEGFDAVPLNYLLKPPHSLSNK